MNRDEVRALAKSVGVKNVSKYTKDQLVDMINAAEVAKLLSLGATDERPSPVFRGKDLRRVATERLMRFRRR